MEAKTSAYFNAEQLDLLIDCIHDRFCAVADGVEPHPPSSRARLLNELSRLHAGVQLAAAALEHHEEAEPEEQA